MQLENGDVPVQFSRAFSAASPILSAVEASYSKTLASVISFRLDVPAYNVVTHRARHGCNALVQEAADQ
jgi:hypothetical protein